MNFQFKAPNETVHDKNREEFEELPSKEEIEEEEREAALEESLEGIKRLIKSNLSFSSRSCLTSTTEGTGTWEGLLTRLKSSRRKRTR